MFCRTGLVEHDEEHEPLYGLMQLLSTALHRANDVHARER
jgi:hypothetical protein